MSKMLLEIDPIQRENIVDSLVYEAQALSRDPINGCLNYVHNLEHQSMGVQQEINNVKSELTKYLSLEVIQIVMNNPDYQDYSSQFE
ncbi:LOB domain-containing protein [Trifolium repens]|nr:LOB domain-containing protein [Trifolium repens]